MLEGFRGTTIQELEAAFSWSIPEYFNIGVDCADRQPPDAVAIRHLESDGRAVDVTYGQLSAQSNQLANLLTAWGVEPGDRVAVVLPQHPRVAIAHLAIYKLGAIAVPLTTLFGPDALQIRLNDSTAKVAIVDEPTHHKVQTLELPALQRMLVNWDDVDQADDRFTPRDTKADDPALLIYTSGTTGPPKGALHGHRVLLGHLPGFELSHDFYGQPGDRFWTPADWAWIGGLYDCLFPVLHFGSSIVSWAPSGPFDPERAFQLIAENQVRNTFLPPTALKLLRQSGLKPPVELKLRSVMSGGESLGAEMLDWAKETFGVTVNEIYGQTECNYVVGNCNTLYPVRPGSMGRGYPGHRVSLVEGEIAVKAPDPVMFLRYWNNPEATADKFQGEWLLTGDMAEQDTDGYFWFKGRKDDVISSAGYRIGPSEIEDCLMRHPSVALAAVVGIPDPIRGQAVKAFVVLKPGSPPDAPALQDFVRHRLAAYEYPRAIEFVSDLPMTTTGKIRRSELRARSS